LYNRVYFYRIFFLLCTFSLLIGCSIAGIKKITVSTLPETKKCFWAIYIIGSTLEDNNNHASNNLTEILKSYGSLTDAEKANLQVVVAFGGAKKQSWKGVKFADLNCLINDYNNDGQFGNETNYDFQDENANMGFAQPLNKFLDYVNDKSQGYDKKMFEFWDHGTDYIGIGPDSNFNDMDGVLTVVEMQNSFEEKNCKFDLLGFDACLMGSLEVGNMLKNYSDYMVASEDSEPGNGWGYESIVKYLCTNPDSSAQDIGLNIVNSYINNPYSNGIAKTLSLVDLRKINPVIEQFNILISNFMQSGSSISNVIMNSLRDTTEYGQVDNESISVDFKSFIDNVKKNKPEVGTIIDELINRYDKYVIYSGSDETQEASGATIFPLNINNTFYNSFYNKSVSVSDLWFEFIQGILGNSLKDNSRPLVNNAQGCNSENLTGQCYEIYDDIGLKDIYEVHAVRLQSETDKHMILLSSIFPHSQNNLYFIEEWTGTHPVICDGSCNSNGKSIYVPAYFGHKDKTGNYAFSTTAKLNDKDVIFYMILNAQHSLVKYSIQPLTNIPGQTEAKIVEKTRFTLKKGDKLQFSYNTLDIEKNANDKIYGEEIIFSDTPEWGVKQVQGDKLYYILAEDTNGNFTTSEISECKTN